MKVYEFVQRNSIIFIFLILLFQFVFNIDFFVLLDVANSHIFMRLITPYSVHKYLTLTFVNPIFSFSNNDNSFNHNLNRICVRITRRRHICNSMSGIPIIHSGSACVSYNQVNCHKAFVNIMIEGCRGLFA